MKKIINGMEIIFMDHNIEKDYNYDNYTGYSLTEGFQEEYDGKECYRYYHMGEHICTISKELYDAKRKEVTRIIKEYIKYMEEEDIKQYQKENDPLFVIIDVL